jgi:hypothetical protein
MKSKLMFGALVKDYDASDFSRKKSTAAAAARAYLKRLRAAEMAEWEMTGGDYVLPAFAANRFHYGMERIGRQDAPTSGNISRPPECRVFTIADDRTRLQ